MYSFWCISCIFVLSVCAWARLEICIPDIGALHFGIERISPKNKKGAEIDGGIIRFGFHHQISYSHRYQQHQPNIS